MLKFRPHHFLCALGFEGKGYSPDFVANFAAIVERLRAPGESERVQLQVVSGLDSVCGPCPNQRGNGCESEQKVRTLDAAHARILELREGETLSWSEAERRLAANMTLARFEEACAPCSWKQLGVCKAALITLQKKNKDVI